MRQSVKYFRNVGRQKPGLVEAAPAALDTQRFLDDFFETGFAGFLAELLGDLLADFFEDFFDDFLEDFFPAIAFEEEAFRFTLDLESTSSSTRKPRWFAMCMACKCAN